MVYYIVLSPGCPSCVTSMGKWARAKGMGHGHGVGFVNNPRNACECGLSALE